MKQVDERQVMKIREWCRKCLVAGMKSIAFQAVRNGNGYVRSSFVAGETEKPSMHGLVVAGVLLALTATFVCLMLIGG